MRRSETLECTQKNRESTELISVIERVKEGDENAKVQLLEQSRSIINGACHQLGGVERRHIDFDDLLQEARISVLHAAGLYSDDRAIPFRRFALLHIFPDIRKVVDNQYGAGNRMPQLILRQLVAMDVYSCDNAGMPDACEMEKLGLDSSETFFIRLKKPKGEDSKRRPRFPVSRIWQSIMMGQDMTSLDEVDDVHETPVAPVDSTIGPCAPEPTVESLAIERVFVAMAKKAEEKGSRSQMDEITALKLHFGFIDDVPYTILQVSNLMDISLAQASGLINKGLSRLRHPTYRQMLADN